ncbi:MAG: hypothetical protein HY365_02790 [Candidatus Aenigmarchaeota archaeon]|nr:hypothetical protein [Candidatus Aenigmarchaeota archaeon]
MRKTNNMGYDTFRKMRGIGIRTWKLLDAKLLDGEAVIQHRASFSSSEGYGDEA